MEGITSRRSLDHKRNVFQDRVRQVGERDANGLFVWGRPGTSKTYTVTTTLKETVGADRYVLANGHLTAIGLYELIESNADKVVVVDDVAPLFRNRVAVNILLAATGAPIGGVRLIPYRRKGRPDVVEFTGGIIAISNVPLHDDPVVAALESRMHMLNFELTDQEMKELMEQIAWKGHTVGMHKLSSDECFEVLEFFLGRCAEHNVRLDARLFVEKALGDFVSWKWNHVVSDWRDLIEMDLRQKVTIAQYSAGSHIPSKEQEIGSELRLLERLLQEVPKDEARKKFMEETGRNERTFQRRVKELKATGKYPKIHAS